MIGPGRRLMLCNRDYPCYKLLIIIKSQRHSLFGLSKVQRAGCNESNNLLPMSQVDSEEEGAPDSSPIPGSDVCEKAMARRLYRSFSQYAW
jgi:hypothetical protein